MDRSERRRVIEMPEPVRERVESNIGLVVNIAARYCNRRLPLEDLVHEGILGLIRAAYEFDPGRGCPFASVAGFWIRKYVWSALSRVSFPVHVPSWQLKKMRRFQAAIRALTEALGRPPRWEEISAEVGNRSGEVDSFFRFWPKEHRLEEDRNDPLCSSLADPYTLSPEDTLLLEERRRIVRGALAELTILEQVVILNRFGLETDEPLTLGRIGEICGLTRQRVLQIEGRAKERLRRGVSRRGWTPVERTRNARGIGAVQAISPT